jgi:excisionase family DNA binding protein
MTFRGADMSPKTVSTPSPLQLYDIPMVATILGVSKRTVQRYVKNRWLKAVKLSPHVVRFKLDDINDFVDWRESGGDTPHLLEPNQQYRLPIN